MLPPDRLGHLAVGRRPCAGRVSASWVASRFLTAAQSMPSPLRGTLRSPRAMCSATERPGTTESATGSSGMPDRAGGEGGPGTALGQLGARHQHRARRRRPQAQGHLVQLPLAVARTRRPRPPARRCATVRSTSLRARWPRSPLHRHPAQLEGGRGRRTGGRGGSRAGRAPCARPWRSISSRSSRVVGSTPPRMTLPPRSTRDPVGDGAGLVQLVGDDDHRQAPGPQLAQAGEEGVDLLGGEHAGGLVEDDELGPGHQHLEDLDPLALADGEVADEGRGVAGQAVAGGGLVDLAGQAGPVEAEALHRAGPGRRSRPRSAPAPGAGPGTPCRCRARGPRPASRCSPATPAKRSSPESGR